jgi:hypothetical protein
MSVIHSLWISGPLKPLNQLTIRSFKKHGHELVLYSYDPSVTQECEVRDAHEIVPRDEVFYYKRMLGGNPNFKFGGIAERLKAEMLYRLGGWHVDLDVTCLKSFDELPAPYVIRPHVNGVVGNIIKAPAESELARRYAAHTRTITADNTVWESSFAGLNAIVAELGLSAFVVPREVLGDDGPDYWERFTRAGEAPGDDLRRS